MTQIVFLRSETKSVLHKRNVILPCHLKGRALSGLKFIHTLTGWLRVTKDINLLDRLGQEGQLGLGTGPRCLQLIGSTGPTPSICWQGIPEMWGEARHYRFKEDKVKDREISRFALLIMWWARDGAKNWIQISQVADGLFHQGVLPHSFPWNCPLSASQKHIPGLSSGVCVSVCYCLLPLHYTDF